MAFELPKLPFAYDALASKGMSKETLEFHHDKHHQGYVNTLNDLVAAKPELAGKSLEDLITLSKGKPDMVGVFNNAGQHFNHSFFWETLSPEGGKMPKKLEEKIIADFGSVEKFKEEFTTAAKTQFGSGWAWLVQTPAGKLAIAKTANAANPISENLGTPLLVIDVWEHAYYLDFRNRRPDFITNYLDKLANYEFAASKLA